MKAAAQRFALGTPIFHLYPALALASAIWLSAPLPAPGAVTATKGQLTLPTYPWSAVKHPYFRGTDQLNIYPYAMMDFLSRERTNRTYRTVVLENEYLRLTFLPELGGKLHEVIDKTVNQPMFYVNHVVKPGLIGQCGAWTSGGVEWNTGPQGHTVSCLLPIPVEILPPEPDGSRSVAIGETERIYGTRWTVVVTLRPGRACIEERIRIYNPTETIRPYYFWNCTAVPNTPGFRFIYPMTLGCDHAGEKFFQWPVDQGKDLARGTNYQDASSIFAWHCDQDFFGSYNDDLDRGVVSFANHHQLPGKKAWTWGRGGFGTMHQMDLTDDDGPYNEVQTGPLLTQAQVGRLDPCEAVEWQEWWYPVHALGGFHYANRDIAVNATLSDGQLRLKMLGTAVWKRVEVTAGGAAGVAGATTCSLSPARVAEVLLPVGDVSQAQVQLKVKGRLLASFRVPLELPVRQPPAEKPKPDTAAALAAAGWQEYLFARYPEAEAQFRKALEKDSEAAAARLGLSILAQDRDPAQSAREAEAALAADPETGLGHFLRAVAAARQQQFSAALEAAWKASLSPELAVASRALAAKLLMRSGGQWSRAADALAGAGPWETDVLCRGRLAFALLKQGETARAAELARANLAVEPLDLFSGAVLWLGGKASVPASFKALVEGNAQSAIELSLQLYELGDSASALRVLQAFYLDRVPRESQTALPGYLAAALRPSVPGATAALAAAPNRSLVAAVDERPYLFASLELLQTGRNRQMEDGRGCLYRGHLLFHLGRYQEGREQWKQAAAQGYEPVIALRALGMAAKCLDNDLKSARAYLEQAHRLDPADPIVARDLAKVLFELADRPGNDVEQDGLVRQARDTLRGAFGNGKGRSDFVALLARAQNRLGEFAESARMLDSVRVTVWEGAREVHDLFEQAHLQLGEAHLKAGRAAEALAEFDRALEYPANLATGKLENTREAHLHFQRGNALAALGRTEEARVAWRRAADEPESKEARIEEARRRAQAALQ
jgi:tetratricopeptide (TPR) repeat protein